MAKTFGAVAGNWSDDAKWVGGVKPTTSDDVLFTVASANCVIDADTAALNSFDCTGYTGTLSGTKNITVTTATGTSTVLFAGTSPTWSGTLLLNPAAGTTINFTMGSALKTAATCGGVTIAGTTTGAVFFLDGFTIGATKTVTLTSGTLHTDGATDNAGLVHSWGIMNYGNTATRTLTLGNSSITITGKDVSGYGWDYDGTTGLTVTANTAIITLTGAGASFAGGSLTWGGSVILAGSGTPILNANGPIGMVTRTGTASKTDGLIFSKSTLIITTALTLNGNSGTNRPIIQSGTLGTAVTITTTGATINCNNVDLRDISLNPGTNAQAIASIANNGDGTVRVTTTGSHGLPTGTSYIYVTATGYTGNYLATKVAATTFDITVAYSATATGTWTYDLTSDATHAGNKLIGDCGGNTRAHFTPASTQECTDNANVNWSAATWTSHMPLPQDKVVISLVATPSAKTLTVDEPRIGGGYDTGITFGTATNLTLGNAVTSYGSVNLTGMGTFSGAQTWTIGSQPRTGTITITSGGKDFPSEVDVSAFGTNVQLADAFSATASSVYLYNGTLTDGNFSITTKSFQSPGTAARSVTKTGNWTITANVAISVVNLSAMITWSDLGGSITISDTGSNAKTFAGAGQTFNNVSFPSGTGGVIITGSNSFNTVACAAGAKVAVTNGTIQTIRNHSRWDGTSGSHITLLSTTPGSFYTITQSAGQLIGNYVDVADCKATNKNTCYCGHNGTLDATSLANNWAKEAGKIIIST